MQCPKCHAMMHTYNRNGVQIEQCSGCRGIFLDYGELEALTRLESQYTSQYGQVPRPPHRRPPLRTRSSTRPPRPPGAPRSTAATATATTATTRRAASAGCSSPPEATGTGPRDRPGPRTRPLRHIAGTARTEQRTAPHTRKPRPWERPGLSDSGARYWD